MTENTSLIFHGNFCGDEEPDQLQCFVNRKNEITISILYIGYDDLETSISLTKETAIKLSKELKKQISYL